MYRSHNQQTVVVSKITISFGARFKALFYRCLYRIFGGQYLQLKVIQSILSGAPDSIYNCVSCGNRECICPDCIVCNLPIYDCECQ